MTIAWVGLGLRFASGIVIAADIFVRGYRLRMPIMEAVWPITGPYVSHCGAGCTLGDIGTKLAVFALALTVAGTALPFEYAGDYIAAIILGLLLQYFAIAPMRGLGVRGYQSRSQSRHPLPVRVRGGLVRMDGPDGAFVFFPGPHLAPVSPVLVLMQIGMIIGFATSWPANVWLINRGIEEAM